MAEDPDFQMPDDDFDGFHNARPARHVERRARSPHGGAQPGSLLLPELPTLGEIEQRIMRVDNELEELVEEHYTAAEEAASAEADWKAHRDRILVWLADTGDKEAADIREARAKRAKVEWDSEMTGEDLYRVYKIREAREKSIDRQIRAIQIRATSLMSVARGIRQASGL